MPELLSGGVANVGKVVRDGDLVLRPAPDNATSIHGLLHHLAQCGFGAPRPVAMRTDGREVMRFVDGDVSVPPYPEPWVRSDETVVSVGRLLRAYHDAVAGFAAPEDAVWSEELADPAGGPLICHNDVCVENVVFARGTAAALLDFDFAAPGRPVWDVAMTARYWVPLLDPISAAVTERGQLDVFARLRLFVDAYGLDDAGRKAFGLVLMEIEGVALRFVVDRMQRGEESFLRMWRDLGGDERHRRKMAWLEENADRIRAAVTG